MIHFRDLQDFLYQGQHLPMRPHYRDLVILYRQRIKVLNRLRSQNFDLYCKTMELLNLEHHQEPILKDRFQIDWQNLLNLTHLSRVVTSVWPRNGSTPSRSLMSSPSKAFVVASGIQVVYTTWESQDYQDGNKEFLNPGRRGRHGPADGPAHRRSS